MKKIVILILSMISMMISVSCSKKCSNEPPQARIINNNANEVSLQIKPNSGSTVNINNVASGTTSLYSPFSAGTLEFTYSIDKTKSFSETYSMSNCNNYDITINADNTVSVKTTSRN